MYKLLDSKFGGVRRTVDNAFIPFDPDNTDYKNFKTDMSNGVELQDVDGLMESIMIKLVVLNLANL